MKASEQLSDKALRQRIRERERVLDEIQRADAAEVVRAGLADSNIARGEQALAELRQAEQELREREHHSLPERLLRSRTLERGKRKPHPASGVLRAAAKMSFPELRNARLVPERLDAKQAAELEDLLKKRRSLAKGEALERPDVDRIELLLGLAASEPDWFEKQRRDVEAKAKLAELADARRLAKVPPQPLLPPARCRSRGSPPTRGSWVTAAGRATGHLWMWGFWLVCSVRSRTATLRSSLAQRSRRKATATRLSSCQAESEVTCGCSARSQGRPLRTALAMYACDRRSRRSIATNGSRLTKRSVR